MSRLFTDVCTNVVIIVNRYYLKTSITYWDCIYLPISIPKHIYVGKNVNVIVFNIYHSLKNAWLFYFSPRRATEVLVSLLNLCLFLLQLSYPIRPQHLRKTHIYPKVEDILPDILTAKNKNVSFLHITYFRVIIRHSPMKAIALRIEIWV